MYLRAAGTEERRDKSSFTSLDGVSTFGEEGQREIHAQYECLEQATFEVLSSSKVLGRYSPTGGLWQGLSQH